MTREEIYEEIKATLGAVPGFVAALDDEHIGPMWEKTKSVFLSEMSIGLKANALAAVAVSYALECQY